MKMQVIRTELTNVATVGKLYVNDEFQCYTCEDVVREIEGQPVTSWKIDGVTAIPRGTYEVIIDFSNHFKRELPHILNVPGYDGIRIHKGNRPEDTEGCLLVGQVKLLNAVGSSEVAFDLLFQKIQAALTAGEDITIEIK